MISLPIASLNKQSWNNLCSYGIILPPSSLFIKYKRKLSRFLFCIYTHTYTCKHLLTEANLYLTRCFNYLHLCFIYTKLSILYVLVSLEFD